MPIPFYGELGSVNPSVVTPRAAKTRADEITSGYTASLTMGSGQFCANPGLLFAPAGLLEGISRRLRETAGAPMPNERIQTGYLETANALAVRTGVRRLVWPDDQNSTAPRLLTMDLAAFKADSEAAAEECFGPLVTYDRPRHHLGRHGRDRSVPETGRVPRLAA